MTPSAEAPKDLAGEPEELTHEEEAEPHHAKRVTGQDACEQPKTTISATMRNSNGTQRTLDLHEGFFVNDEFSHFATYSFVQRACAALDTLSTGIEVDCFDKKSRKAPAYVGAAP